MITTLPIFVIQGSMEFFVRVDHVDSGVAGAQGIVDEDTLVARFFIPIAASPAGNGTFIADPPYRDFRNQGPFIGLAFHLRCAENFYGEDCTRTCFSSDEGERHVCNSDGFLECREGFQNLEKNCSECALAPGCCKS